MSIASDQDSSVVIDETDPGQAHPPLDDVKQAIEKLTWPQLSQLMTWLNDHFQNAWDRQMEEDALAGKLDRLSEQARDDLRNGLCSPL